MKSTTRSPLFRSISLCSKGLVQASAEGEFSFDGCEQGGSGGLGGNRKLMGDHVVIRSGFNRWHGPIEGLDHVMRERELSERENTLRAVYRLYELGCSRLAPSLRRSLSVDDVENVLTAFRRLSLAGKIKPNDVVDYCEKQPASNHGFADVIDPLQLRHVLSFHTDSVGKAFGPNELHRLTMVYQNGEPGSIRAWFEALGNKKDTLPKETPQFLRRLLLDLWNEGGMDLDIWAFEITALDVSMFDEIGWENSRMFFSLLKRIAGASSPVFAGFLNDEDVDQALTVYKAIGNKTQEAYFRSLLAVFDTQALRSLRRAAFAQVERIERSKMRLSPAIPAAAPKPVAAPVRIQQKKFFGLFSFMSNAA